MHYALWDLVVDLDQAWQSCISSTHPGGLVAGDGLRVPWASDSVFVSMLVMWGRVSLRALVGDMAHQRLSAQCNQPRLEHPHPDLSGT